MIMKDKVFLRVRFSKILVDFFTRMDFVGFGFSMDDWMVSGLDFFRTGFFGFGFYFRIWILILFFKDRFFSTE
jgi:hypothetical protein